MGSGQSAIPGNWKEKYGLKDEDDFTGSVPAKGIDFKKLAKDIDYKKAAKQAAMADDDIPF
jgi:hypothetical protein